MRRIGTAVTCLAGAGGRNSMNAPAQNPEEIL